MKTFDYFQQITMRRAVDKRKVTYHSIMQHKTGRINIIPPCHHHTLATKIQASNHHTHITFTGQAIHQHSHIMTTNALAFNTQVMAILASFQLDTIWTPPKSMSMNRCLEYSTYQRPLCNLCHQCTRHHRCQILEKTQHIVQLLRLIIQHNHPSTNLPT